MTARELIDAYALEDSTHLSVDGMGYEREAFAPKAFDALRAVLDKHRSVPVYEGGLCCGHCLDEDGYMKAWPCPTVRAIEEALR